MAINFSTRHKVDLFSLWIRPMVLLDASWQALLCAGDRGVVWEGLISFDATLLGSLNKKSSTSVLLGHPQAYFYKP